MSKRWEGRLGDVDCDLYRRVRRTHFVDGMSTREVAWMFNLHRNTVNKMLEYSGHSATSGSPPHVGRS